MASKAFEIIKYRMSTLGIDLQKYLASELNAWDNGFNFIPKDWKAFAWALRDSGQFCIETGLASRFQEKGSISWRQVGDKEQTSMHVLFRKGKPYPTFKNVVEYYQIHIDSVQVVAGQECGKCFYHLDALAKHNVVDKWRLPFIVPDREGLRIGVRF